MKAVLMGNTFSAEQEMPIMTDILLRDCSKESGV